MSILLEKVQVAVLADRLGELLAELERRGVPEVLASGADPAHGPRRHRTRWTNPSTRRFAPVH